MWKLFWFPWDDSGESRVNFGSLDIVFAYKTIERFDESVAQDVAVAGNCLGLDHVWGRAELRSLAQHSLQLVGVE